MVYKLPGAKGSLFGPKRFPRPLFIEDCAHSNRQHHSGCLHKQGRRHEVGSTLCHIMENPDLVFLKTDNFQGLMNPRLAECGNIQAIQAGPDHQNRVVPPSRCLPVDMHHVAPTSNRPVYNEVQQ